MGTTFSLHHILFTQPELYPWVGPPHTAVIKVGNPFLKAFFDFNNFFSKKIGRQGGTNGMREQRNVHTISALFMVNARGVTASAKTMGESCEK